VPDPLGGNTDPFAPLLDSHAPWASPLREHKTDPANPMGDSESGQDLHHVRVVGNKAKRHDYDAGVYFSGCHDTQTFWAPTGRGGGGYMGGPEVTRPDQRQWELEKAATLRKFVDRLDDVWVRIVDHAWESPGAQFVSVWTEADGIPDIMPTPPGVNVNVGEDPPCLVSACVRDKLVETMREADRERQVRKRLAEARLREAELEIQAQKDEHAELGKQAARKARKEARLAKKARARRAQLEPAE
jgi:hypothetical protein